MSERLLPYREAVVASRWFGALLALAVAAAAGGLVGLWQDQSTDGWPRWLMSGTLLAVGALLLLVWRWFGRLRIEVDEHALRFRFGALRCTLEAERIARAVPEPYRWWQYGGWGWRFALVGRRLVRAYSVPFVRSGVAVETTDGKRYYLSSRAPAELAAVLAALSGRRR